MSLIWLSGGYKNHPSVQDLTKQKFLWVIYSGIETPNQRKESKQIDFFLNIGYYNLGLGKR